MRKRIEPGHKLPVAVLRVHSRNSESIKSKGCRLPYRLFKSGYYLPAVFTYIHEVVRCIDLVLVNSGNLQGILPLGGLKPEGHILEIGVHAVPLALLNLLQDIVSQP